MRIVSPFCLWQSQISGNIYFKNVKKTGWLDSSQQAIIIPLLLRWCWNWQTGMVEGHVPQGVRVQLPPSALNRREAVCFFSTLSKLIID